MEEISFLPEGYHFVSQFRYPRKILNAAESLPIFTALIFYLIGDWDPIHRIFRGVAAFQRVASWEAGIFIIVAIFSTQLFHGLIKRGINHLLGYDISFFTLLLFFLEPTFATASEQFQSRRDALLIAIGPLSLFIFLLAPLLLGSPGIIGSIATIFLLTNLAGTVCDFYFICYLLRRPRGTVLYVEDYRTLLVFEPIPVSVYKG